MAALANLVDRLATLLFGHRRLFLVLFGLITALLAWSATHLKVDAGFAKSVPTHHPYMKTFGDYQKTFGGANRIVIGLRTTDADIYNERFLKTLKSVTDDLFFIPGVDRATAMSLFTPNVRYIEVVEGGFRGGNVIPSNFDYSPESLAQVRGNVLKSNYLGRLVSNDFKGAIVSAELLEVDPQTGDKLDYAAFAGKLEDIRNKYTQDGISVHIIGFAQAVGDISAGAKGVLSFFIIAFAITTVLLFWYSGSAKLTALALLCAMLPVVWLLGILPLIGFGIDPMSILLPFLIFAIGVSHAVQMTNAWKLEVLEGASALQASNAAFRKLFVPGAMALLANALGFMVIIVIDIPMVRELAVSASIGVAVMIITNKMFLTVLLSYLRMTPQQARAIGGKESSGDWMWSRLKHLAEPRAANVVLAVTVALLAIGAWKAREIRTGDLGRGIPELRENSRYNQDTVAIVDNFSIGVDVLSVIAKGEAGACTNYEVMSAINRFENHMRDTYGVQSTMSVASLAKMINAGWNEGNPRWRALSRNNYVLAQSVGGIDTSTGLLNTDCSAMQILIFTRDHEGTTIKHIVEEIKHWTAANPSDQVQFLLASGNVGVMAATNEAVEEAEVLMLVLLFAAIGLLCFLEFRDWRAVLCIIVPLAIVAVLCNALMAMLGIGLKVATLPVIALGVGVGVDYGIYLFERLKYAMLKGMSLPEAFHLALQQRGSAAFFTAITMSIGVGTWAMSALKFQADMGVLLAFLFVVNMLGAIFLLPAIASKLLRAPRIAADPSLAQPQARHRPATQH